MTVEVQAHAKINLSLRILGKRPDCFHALETLITSTKLHDTLRISKNASGLRFTCSHPELETDDNLVIRAVRLLERETNSSLPLKIHLEKRTPSGAGLGGGSSDAAATMTSVRQLYHLDLDDKRLQTLAAELGSDIPFFIRGGTAWCRGRGEELETIDFPWELNLFLLKHPLEISTPWAYQKWATSREVPGIPYSPQSRPWGDVYNDLERPAFEKFLIIGDTKRWLLEQPEVEVACMTGSGSAVFALLRDHLPATHAALAEKARERYGSHLWIF